MRPATCYFLAQAWAPRDRQAPPGALPRAGYRRRHARPHPTRRIHPGRELPGLARRVLAALSGTSQSA
jgi:hypothetical protein